MIKIYEASTSLDAHMVANLLQQHNIETQIEGELLQGGIGDLQAMNFVRIMAEEKDAEAARDIIKQWEATQPDKPAETNDPAQPLNGLIIFIAGLIAGIVISYLSFRAQ